MMLNKLRFGLSLFVIVVSLNGCSTAGGTNQQSTSAPLQTQAQSTSIKASNSTSGSVVQTTTNAKDAASATTNETAAANQNEKPVAPEKNPPGDIPDTQVFVKYTSTQGGYELQFPEGWAQTENGPDVKFVDKYDGLQVNVVDESEPATLDSIKNKQEVELIKTGRAVSVKSVKEVKISGNKVFVISYDSNSEANPVTNKKIRLENKNYYFCKDGKMAVVKVWAPLGADNIDQWNFISENLKWR
jgi:PsbP.